MLGKTTLKFKTTILGLTPIRTAKVNIDNKKTIKFENKGSNLEFQTKKVGER